MKKIFTLACVAAISTTLLADISRLQNQPAYPSLVPAKVSEKVDMERAAKNVATREDKADMVMTAAQALQKDTTIVMEGWYGQYGSYKPSAFMTGTPANLAMLAGPANLYVPYNKAALLNSNFKGTWTLGGNTVAQDTFRYILPLGADLTQYELPVFQANPLQLNKDTTCTFPAYQFGAYFNSKYAKYGFASEMDNASGWSWMTQCHIYTEIESYEYNGTTNDTYGDNKYMGAGWYSATELGYLYGSGVNIPWSETEIVRYDTIISVIDNSDLIAIDGVTLGVFGVDKQTLMYKKPTIGSVTMTLYPVSIQTTEEGSSYKIDYEHPYASATSDSTKFTPLSSSQGTNERQGTLYFEFMEEILGTMEPTTVSIDGDFAVVLTGLNDDPVNNFGIMSDGDVETPRSANTWLKGGGETIRVWRNPLNLLINFAAVYPVIANPTEKIELALSGSSETLTLMTNIESGDWDIDADEWIKYEMTDKTVTDEDEEYFDNEVTLTISADQTDVAREGTISLNLYGKEYTITVKQGDMGQSIENTKFVNDGKLYNVLGQEVGEDYQGIVIKNGQKYLQ